MTHLDQPSALDALREEAAIEPDPVHDGEVTKETQVIAIYGKGGSGKSFALSNLSYMMAQQGKRVLLIGCDPKSDTTSLLFGGKACPTIIETSSKKKLAGEEVSIEDVCFQRDGVFAMELGGPEVGRGCGGRGIIHGFELLEKLGFHEWGFDYVLLDFLGDVVCGGFGLPIARDMCQKVIVVGSNDLQSLYVANNVCKAVEYFRSMGGNVGVAGMIVNKDDGTGEAQAFAKAVDIPVLCAIPANDDIRLKRFHRHRQIDGLNHLIAPLDLNSPGAPIHILIECKYKVCIYIVIRDSIETVLHVGTDRHHLRRLFVGVVVGLIGAHVNDPIDYP